MEYIKKEFQFKLNNDLWRLQFQKVDNQSVKFCAFCRSKLTLYEQTYTVTQLQKQCKYFYIYSDPDPEELITDIENICKKKPVNDHISFNIKENLVEFVMKIQVVGNKKDLIISINEKPQNWKESHQELLDRINKNEEFILIANQLTQNEHENCRYAAFQRLKQYDQFMNSFDDKMQLIERLQQDKLDYQIKKLGGKQKLYKKEVKQVIETNLSVTKAMLNSYKTMFKEFKNTTLKIIIEQQETNDKLAKQINFNEQSIQELNGRLEENYQDNIKHRQLIKQILHNHSDQYNQSFSQFKKELITLIDENKEETDLEDVTDSDSQKEPTSNKNLSSQ